MLFSIIAYFSHSYIKANDIVFYARVFLFFPIASAASIALRTFAAVITPAS